jgi:hypothetical protein
MICCALQDESDYNVENRVGTQHKTTVDIELKKKMCLRHRLLMELIIWCHTKGWMQGFWKGGLKVLLKM